MTMDEINAVIEAMTRFARINCQTFADNKMMSDTDIVKCKALIKPWESGKEVKEGYVRTYNDKVYRVREGQGHTTQDDWTPDKTPNLWAIIDVTHAGTVEDPIPAARGMDYEYGKHYLDPEDNHIYLCKRGEETGTINLQYLPHEVISNYFVLVK